MTEPSPSRPASPLLELTKARLREFYREPGAVFWVFGFPVLMVIGLGIAFRDREPEKPRVSVSSEAATWVTPALEQAGFAPLSFQAEEGLEQLRSGKVDLLVSTQASGLEFRFDASRPESQLARTLVNDALQRAQGRTDPVSVNERVVTAPGSRYVDFLLPGIIALNLMGSSLWGIGYSIIVSRKRKLLRRFAASPMRHSHFLMAYGLSRLVYLAAELCALLLFGTLAFGVEVQGSFASIVVVSLIGAASFAALSLVIAARVEGLEAANGWLNAVMLPMWLLSGCFFSYERFPEAFHPFIRALPLTALTDALRSISSEGASLFSTWPELLVLGTWGVLSFFIALRTFRWQ